MLIPNRSRIFIPQKMNIQILQPEEDKFRFMEVESEKQISFKWKYLWEVILFVQMPFKLH